MIFFSDQTVVSGSLPQTSDELHLHHLNYDNNDSE